jgi:hypothetical protein
MIDPFRLCLLTSCSTSNMQCMSVKCGWTVSVYQSCVFPHMKYTGQTDETNWLTYKDRVNNRARFIVRMWCPIFQVITASWEAARGALVMMVLEMGSKGHLDAHIGVASWVAHICRAGDDLSGGLGIRRRENRMQGTRIVEPVGKL